MVRITVLKKQFNSDIAELLNMEEFKKCTLFQEGQEFDTVIQKPEGFCEDAWKILYPFIFALNHGANGFDACENSLRKLTELNSDEPVICCCCNGIHPVVFKIEKVEEMELSQEITDCKENQDLMEKNKNDKVKDNNSKNWEEGNKNNIETMKGGDKSEDEELIVPVYEDTATTEIIDQFENIGNYSGKHYKRLVIENPLMTYYTADLGIYCCIHCVIEDVGYCFDSIGSITFTDYKKRNTRRLRTYIENELKNCDIKYYLDNDKYFKFKDKFILRAQSSEDRNWAYGATSEYIISGVYISNNHTYNPKTRVHNKVVRFEEKG